MHNGVDAVGIDQQVKHLLLLLSESAVEKQVCYNLESKQRENFSCTLNLSDFDVMLLNVFSPSRTTGSGDWRISFPF